MKIRAAKPEDLPAIRDVHLQSWRTAYAGILPADFLGNPLKNEMTRRWREMPCGSHILLVSVRDKVEGFAFMRLDDPRGPHLENLHVMQSAQGAGIGRALMRSLAEGLKNRGMTTLWLEVLDDNASARRFYARLGGAEGPVFLDNLIGNNVPARRIIWTGLEKILAPDEKS